MVIRAVPAERVSEAVGWLEAARGVPRRSVAKATSSSIISSIISVVGSILVEEPYHSVGVSHSRKREAAAAL